MSFINGIARSTNLWGPCLIFTSAIFVYELQYLAVTGNKEIA